MRKSFKREIGELFTDWNQYGLTPAVQSEWLRLWQACLRQEQGSIVPVDQVGSLALLGYAIAMKRGNYTEAADVWTPYFEHPDLQTESEEDRTFKVRRATSYLYAGDTAHAIEEYRSALTASSGKEQATIVLFILGGIRSYCLDQPATAVAEQKLIDFVYEVQPQGFGSSSKQLEQRSLTYEDLTDETMKTPFIRDNEG